MSRAARFFIVVSLLLGAALARAEPAVTLTIKSHAVSAEVAATEAERERGLMFRKTLPQNHGMLFVFDVPYRYSMWMENTYLPLSVAFLDQHGNILNIEEMQPLSGAYHTAAGDAWYALEMNAAWFSGHGIRAGDKVEGLNQTARKR